MKPYIYHVRFELNQLNFILFGCLWTSSLQVERKIPPPQELSVKNGKIVLYCYGFDKDMTW